MGICTSCEATSVATAKVVSEDGILQEFCYPVKASYVLAKDPTRFLCNSDEMEFDVVVSAVRDDEELQLGQLYFALPITKLRRPLLAEEMAALAVKANAALHKGGGSNKYCCRKKGGGVGLVGEDSPGKVADGGAAPVQVRRVRNGDGRRNIFRANLGTILEEK